MPRMIRVPTSMPTFGLRVVSRWHLSADLFDVFAINFDHLKGRFDERLDGRLSIGLQDQTCMA